MKCDQCDGILTSERENYRYEAVDGFFVTLVGVVVNRCGACGEHEVEIPRIAELHRTVALGIVRKKARLAPAEIRFLRKYLGWSGADFARHVGVTPSTVSRWENGEPMGATADRLLRLMATHGRPVAEYPLSALEEVTDVEAAPVPMRVAPSKSGWQTQATA